MLGTFVMQVVGLKRRLLDWAQRIRTCVDNRKGLRTAIDFRFHSIKVEIHLTTIGVTPMVLHLSQLNQSSVSTDNTTLHMPSHKHSKLSPANPYTTRRFLYRYQQGTSSSQFLFLLRSLRRLLRSIFLPPLIQTYLLHNIRLV